MKIIRKDLNYNQGVNWLLAGVADKVVYRRDDPILIVVRSRVVDKVTGASFTCQCGCKAHYEWVAYKEIPTKTEVPGYAT